MADPNLRSTQPESKADASMAHSGSGERDDRRVTGKCLAGADRIELLGGHEHGRDDTGQHGRLGQWLDAIPPQERREFVANVHAGLGAGTESERYRQFGSRLIERYRADIYGREWHRWRDDQSSGYDDHHRDDERDDDSTSDCSDSGDRRRTVRGDRSWIGSPRLFRLGRFRVFA